MIEIFLASLKFLWMIVSSFMVSLPNMWPAAMLILVINLPAIIYKLISDR